MYKSERQNYRMALTGLVVSIVAGVLGFVVAETATSSATRNHGQELLGGLVTFAAVAFAIGCGVAALAVWWHNRRISQH